MEAFHVENLPAIYTPLRLAADHRDEAVAAVALP